MQISISSKTDYPLYLTERNLRQMEGQPITVRVEGVEEAVGTATVVKAEQQDGGLYLTFEIPDEIGRLIASNPTRYLSRALFGIASS